MLAWYFVCAILGLGLYLTLTIANPAVILYRLRTISTDMRKALPRDKEKKSVVPLPHPVMPQDLEW